jgi:hypothetical protein
MKRKTIQVERSACYLQPHPACRCQLRHLAVAAHIAKACGTMGFTMVCGQTWRCWWSAKRLHAWLVLEVHRGRHASLASHCSDYKTRLHCKEPKHRIYSESKCRCETLEKQEVLAQLHAENTSALSPACRGESCLLACVNAHARQHLTAHAYKRRYRTETCMLNQQRTKRRVQTTGTRSTAFTTTLTAHETR